MRRQHPIRLAAAAPVALALALAGPSCNKDDTGPTADAGTPSSCTQLDTCAGGGTISGTVYAPNGRDPVAGAAVYVPLTINPYPTGPSCDACGQPLDPACARRFTAADGTFTLAGVPARAGVQIAIQKGRFRKILTLDVPCGNVVLNPEQGRLPANPGEGDVPRVAVVTGAYDTMECVVKEAGLAFQVIELYDGINDPPEDGRPSAMQLFTDPARMNQYAVIFVNCTEELGEISARADVLRNLSDYVAAGGRLYVTDWSYDYVEQVTPWAGIIDFEPDGSGDAPEPRGTAKVGKATAALFAHVVDDTLANWLRLFRDTIDGQNRIVAQDFLEGWAVQRSVNPFRGKVWVEAVVEGTAASGIPASLRPLTTTADVGGCGRVLYSSYHTLPPGPEVGINRSNFPAYCRAEGLSSQERILLYLMLEISTCVEGI